MGTHNDVITDSNALENRLAALAGEKFVAIDTEFVREKTYYPQLCLVQIAGESDAFAVDVLAEGLDLAPLKALLENTDVLKVFHACPQDVALLLHSIGVMPLPLFDTQVAAQMLGFGEAASYARLTEELCGVEIDKTLRYMDWSKRPMSREQIDYALSDVIHLRQVYTALVKDLEEKGRYAWAMEEMEPLRQAESYDAKPEEAWTKLRLRSTKPSFLALVRALAAWRERTAQKHDKPRQWILRDETLLEIAAANPKTPEALAKIRNVHGSQSMREGIFAALEEGRSAEPPKMAKKKLPPIGSGPIMDLLKILLKMQSEQHGIAASVIARADDIEQFVIQKKPDVPAMHGWRHDLFGKHAIALKEGRLAMMVQKGRIILLEQSE